MATIDHTALHDANVLLGLEGFRSIKEDRVPAERVKVGHGLFFIIRREGGDGNEQQYECPAHG
jgi:hypothetical protein